MEAIANLLMETVEHKIESIVAGATPGHVVLTRIREEGCTKLVLRAENEPCNQEDEPLLQISLYHESNLDLFIDAHYGLVELDGTDPDTRELIFNWTRAVLFLGYEELVAQRFGRTIKLALRLGPSSPTIWTRGFWTNALSSSKRWVHVGPAVSFDSGN